MRTCQDEPSAPQGAYTQRDVAVWMIDLTEAGRDCRDTLGRVVEIYDAAVDGAAVDAAAEEPAL